MNHITNMNYKKMGRPPKSKAPVLAMLQLNGFQTYYLIDKQKDYLISSNIVNNFRRVNAFTKQNNLPKKGEEFLFESNLQLNDFQPSLIKPIGSEFSIQQIVSNQMNGQPQISASNAQNNAKSIIYSPPLSIQPKGA